MNTGGAVAVHLCCLFSLGARWGWGWGGSLTPRPGRFALGKSYTISIAQVPGWAPGQV